MPWHWGTFENGPLSELHLKAAKKTLDRKGKKLPAVLNLCKFHALLHTECEPAPPANVQTLEFCSPPLDLENNSLECLQETL